MVRAGFRHLVVVEGNEVTGLLSMRDIVRCWAEAGILERGEPTAVRT
jgi:signal-transduction protein with cAMP-binding, CBS, and nucleotidyltransferase domain